MMATGWKLTVRNDKDEIIHEATYGTLAEVATLFELRRGGDLSLYRRSNRSVEQALGAGTGAHVVTMGSLVFH